jgi:hypothetical protein
VDQTGLTDSYDFTLNWDGDETYSAVPDALEQFGLKLEMRKVPTQVFASLKSCVTGTLSQETDTHPRRRRQRKGGRPSAGGGFQACEVNFTLSLETTRDRTASVIKKEERILS